MKPISFGSYYKAYVLPNSTEDQKKGMMEVIAYCLNNSIPYGVTFPYKEKNNPTHELEITTITEINAPNEKDIDIETIFANRGIKVIKRAAENVKDIEAIKKRIKQPSGKQIVYVDAKRLEKISQEQHSNIAKSKAAYENGSKKTAMETIESGKELNLPTLVIDACASSNDEAIEDLQYYGPDFILPISYYMDLDPYSKNGNANLFFVMQELGMKNVPVYIYPKSYDLIKAMDLIREE